MKLSRVGRQQSEILTIFISVNILHKRWFSLMLVSCHNVCQISSFNTRYLKKQLIRIEVRCEKALNEFDTLKTPLKKDFQIGRPICKSADWQIGRNIFNHSESQFLKKKERKTL